MNLKQMTKKQKIVRLLKIKVMKRKYTYQYIADKYEVSRQYVMQINKDLTNVTK